MSINHDSPSQVIDDEKLEQDHSGKQKKKRKKNKSKKKKGAATTNDGEKAENEKVKELSVISNANSKLEEYGCNRYDNKDQDDNDEIESIKLENDDV